jgi:hypothetical protein
MVKNRGGLFGKISFFLMRADASIIVDVVL